eukprot:768385-Hanusia_phi.AAC.3
MPSLSRCILPAVLSPPPLLCSLDPLVETSVADVIRCRQHSEQRRSEHAGGEEGQQCALSP